MRRLSDLTVAVACELFNEAAAAGTGKSDIDFINARMPYSNEKLPVRARVTDRESTRNKLKTKGNWMRRTTGVFSLVSIAVLLGALGCSTLHKSDSVTLQGTWQGREIGGKTEGPCYLAVSGTNAEYRGADTNEWNKGTFSLRQDTNPRQIVFLSTACSYAPCIGQTIHAIYRIEAGTLKLTANEPGSPDVPSAFDASGARQFEFTKK